MFAKKIILSPNPEKSPANAGKPGNNLSTCEVDRLVRITRNG